MLLWVHNVDHQGQRSSINIKMNWIALVTLTEDFIKELRVLSDSILLFNLHQERVQNEYVFVDLMDSPTHV